MRCQRSWRRSRADGQVSRTEGNTHRFPSRWPLLCSATLPSASLRHHRARFPAVRVECHTESILGGSSTRSTDMGLQDFNKVAPWHPCTFAGSRGCCRGLSLQRVYPQAPALDRRRTYCFQSSLSCNTHHPFLTLASRVESILRVSGSRSCTGQSTEALQENREREGFAVDCPNQNKKKTIPFSVSPPTIQVLYRR